MLRMKSTLRWLAGLAALCWCCSAPAWAQDTDTSEIWVPEYAPLGEPAPFSPWVSVTGQLLWLHRTEADSDQTLVTASTALASNAVMRMDHLNFPTEAGFRGSLLIGPATGRHVELAYSGIFDQDASVLVDIDPATSGVVQTSRRFFGDTATSLTNFDYTAQYDSDFHSPEINLWLCSNEWCLRPLVGARWIRQTEQYRLFETATPGNGGVAEFSNELLGGQIGFQTILWQRADWFRVQAICKAGVYQNDMDMNATLNTAGVPVATLNREFNATSYSGEINVTAMWQLMPCLNFHVGYTGLWLTDVGLVGDQNDNFDINAGTGTVDLGGISYQGGHLGVTFSW